MVTGIIALITALAVAIPTIWAWKVSSDKRKMAQDHVKRKLAIRKAVMEGDIDKVRREMARWL